MDGELGSGEEYGGRPHCGCLNNAEQSYVQVREVFIDDLLQNRGPASAAHCDRL